VLEDFDRFVQYMARFEVENAPERIARSCRRHRSCPIVRSSVAR
jgi:hypothetical protein